MLSFSPLSANPFASLSGISILYARALLGNEIVLELGPAIKFYQSVEFNCFLNFDAAFYPNREINVYHTMYTKTYADYTMTVDTSEVQILYYLATFDAVSYITTELSLVLELKTSIDFIMTARDESLMSIDFIMNVVKETL